MTGIVRTSDTKEKIRAAKIGKRLSEAHKLALKNASRKINKKAVLCIETGEVFESILAAVKAYGDSVRKCLAGKTKTAYTYH